MAERATPTDFARWVDPHLTSLARCAGRQVSPESRDEIVQQTLVRAYRRWSTYEGSRETAAGWLLALVVDSPRSPGRQPGGDAVELLDRAPTDAPSGDADLERAVDGLPRAQRLAVDLWSFVGLDLATVAAVLHTTPRTVEDTLADARGELRRLLGAPDDERIDQRLSAATRRWQEAQPAPPEVAIARLGEPRRPEVRWGRRIVGVAVVLVAGAALVSRVGSVPDRKADAPPPAGAPSQVQAPPTAGDLRGVKTVPYRDLRPAHRELAHGQDLTETTSYDSVSASGAITGTVHPGDTLAFDAVLESPGLVSLRPCPDYTITIGGRTSTRQLNCDQVPYYASLVRPTGRVTAFRPVLPAGTLVRFEMRVTVPDAPGSQEVRWALVGPGSMPGFSGVVDIAQH